MAKKKHRHREQTETAVDNENAAVTDAQAEKSQEPDDRTEEEKLRARVAELEDRLLRSLAEFDNYKKRSARLHEQMANSANDKLLNELLDVVDNFERALQHQEPAGGSDAFRQGIEMIYSQLTGLLNRYGVTAIEAIGKPFDANLHDALIRVASDKYDEGVVVDEISKGYKIGDRVLRHSKVSVSMGPEKSETAEVPVMTEDSNADREKNEQQ